MKNTPNASVPYRCYFQQLKDGSWLGEDWRVLGVSAVAPTFEQCRDKLRQVIVDEFLYTRESTGAGSAAVTVSDLHEERKSDEVIEFTVNVPHEVETARKREKRSQA